MVLVLRIESGDLRGRKLSPLPRGIYVRPVGARIRGAVFDSLRAHVPGAHVLDLFAGSGVMSFEALSRGAASATCVEREPRLVKRLRAEVERLGVGDRFRVHADDVVAFAAAPAPRRYDFVLLDPPFAEAEILTELTAALAAGGFLAPGAVLVSQRPKSRGEVVPVTWPPSLSVVRTKSYGQSVMDFLQHDPT